MRQKSFIPKPLLFVIQQSLYLPCMQSDILTAS